MPAGIRALIRVIQRNQCRGVSRGGWGVRISDNKLSSNVYFSHSLIKRSVVRILSKVYLRKVAHNAKSVNKAERWNF